MVISGGDLQPRSIHCWIPKGLDNQSMQWKPLNNKILSYPIYVYDKLKQDNQVNVAEENSAE